VKRTFTFELSNMLGTLGIGAAVTRRPYANQTPFHSGIQPAETGDQLTGMQRARQNVSGELTTAFLPHL